MAVQRAPHSPSPEIITQPLPPEIVALLIVPPNNIRCLCLNDTRDTDPINSKIVLWAEGQAKPGAYLLFVDELKQLHRRGGVVGL